MSFILPFEKLSKRDVRIAGGKGASLGEMLHARISVPPGFVILASAFDRFLKEADLKAEIESIVYRINYKDIAAVEHASETLRDLIHDARMPKDLQTEILGAYHALARSARGRTSAPAKDGTTRGTTSGLLVAVRSSATAEDSSQASWAGELESYVNTTEKVLIGNVKKCWSSLFTPRAIVYRNEKGMRRSQVSVAVVVQKMVQSEISGVTFTVHPVTKYKNQMIIEAVWGLGEAMVGGLVTPDSYIIDKSDWSLIETNVSEQKKMIVRKQPSKKLSFEREKAQLRTTGGTREITVPPKLAHKQKLNGRQIVELAKLCAKIETHYKFPCDIEWAFEKGKFYIVQSRPITTLS